MLRPISARFELLARRFVKTGPAFSRVEDSVSAGPSFHSISATKYNATMPHSHLIPAPGAFFAGVAIFLIVLWDAFESIILPRRVTRKFRLTRLFYRITWTVAKAIGNLIRYRKMRENFLGFF